MLAQLTALAILCSQNPAEATLQLCPENPHYVQYQGKPTLLVTSGEHYGAVLNLDFDFLPYLDELAGCGLNLTRTFAGTYREVPGSFKIQNNTLAPKPDRFLSPWVKVEGAKNGQPERFDLDRFEPAYFQRLKAFLGAAAERGIIVELVLFCPNYNDDLWAVNPMNARNNVNKLGDCPQDEPYTLKHPALLERQLAFVRKVVRELNSFDNLYYEICNEPYFGGVTLDWQHRIAETIAETEKELPKKHLIAQNIANDKAKVESLHPAVSIINFHYAEPAAALDNLKHRKPIADDETGFDGNDDRPYRTEAWRFLLSRGAIFSNLDYSFTPDNEDGSAKVTAPTPGGGGRALRKQLAFLKSFLEGFDWLKMRPAPALIPSKLPKGVQGAALADPPRQYAFYFSGGKKLEFPLELSAGDYQVSWIDPRTVRSLGTESFSHSGGEHLLKSPEFEEDIALSVLARPETSTPNIVPSSASTPKDQTPPAPRRLRVSDNRRFLQDQDGNPFFYLADTAWELFHRLNREEAARYLEDRQRKGFNVIQAVVLAELDGLNTPNALGNKPLLDNDPARPNEAYFQHVDFIVDTAEKLGITIGMLPTWGDKVNKKWGAGPVVFNPENARLYGEFLGKRYREKPIIWVLGGDRPVENDTHRAIWDAMAQGLKSGDGGNHLFTYHPMGGSSSRDNLPDSSWIDFHMIQSGHSQKDSPNYEMIGREYLREPIKPILDGEPRYENHPVNWKPEQGWFDEFDVRQALYWSVFAGGCGVTYGCHDIWQMWQPGRDPISSARTPWQDAISLPASSQAGYLKNLMLSRPFFNRVPDQSLIAGENPTGRDHVLATRAEDGSYAFIYIPSGKPTSINLAKLAGESLRVSWFDPRTGKSAAAGDLPRAGIHEFQPPTPNADWVLVLDSAR